MLTYKNTLLMAALAVATVSSGAHAQDEEPIKIGFAIALSGWMANYDVEPHNAAEMVIEEINKNGGLLGRQARLALRPGRHRDAGDLVALAPLRRPPDLQLLRDRDRAVPDPRRGAAARRDPRARPGRLTSSYRRSGRRRHHRRRRDRQLRLVLADLHRRPAHPERMAPADLVPPLDLTPRRVASS